MQCAFMKMSGWERSTRLGVNTTKIELVLFTPKYTPDQFIPPVVDGTIRAEFWTVIYDGTKSQRDRWRKAHQQYIASILKCNAKYRFSRT